MPRKTVGSTTLHRSVARKWVAALPDCALLKAVPKAAKTQWDFGELFPVEQTRKVFSVTELTVQLRRLLESQFAQTWVTGEITNLRVQSSGHAYFTLKDAGAQLSCVLFRGEMQVDRATLQDGRKVIVRGEVTVYEPRGQYQLRVTAVELQGEGALQIAFEKLKQKLKAEGLFDTPRKRQLPRYCERIGLVTSPTGAAIRDVLHVIERRHRGLEVILAPCRVQGEGAALEIAAAIRLLNAFSRKREGAGLDLILLTRGGGSLEDLWAFNEEAVARAIFASDLPVVSAVGHEVDFTISDFVADVRAATPSVAAEIITEGVYSSCQFIHDAHDRLSILARQRLHGLSEHVGRSQLRLNRVHPQRRLQDNLQRMDDLLGSLRRCAAQGLRRHAKVWQEISSRLTRARPLLSLKRRRELVYQIQQRFHNKTQTRVREMKTRLRSTTDKLKLLGPEQVLARGYSITFEESSGVILRNSSDAKPGALLRTKVHKGEIKSRVEEH